MKVGSLFSGIGGFDLGLERAGYDIAWQVEIDPYCQRVLAKHWPSVTRYGDICTMDWGTVEPVDLLCGGFPCQPFSYAGLRQGQRDNRALWPEVVRSVITLRPTWFIGENVPGFISLGLDAACADLEAHGYTVWPVCLPACSVGAPHKRERLFLLAHTTSPRSQRLGGQRQLGQGQGQVQTSGSHWWSCEPGIQRVAHGVSDWLDGLDLEPCLRVLSMYVAASNDSSTKALSMVREAYGASEVFQWRAGSTNHVCSSEILLPFLLRLQAHVKQEFSAQTGEKVTKEQLRILPYDKKSSSTPSRSKLSEQLPEQYPNSVQELSRFLAQYCKTAWDKDRGSYASNRVNRLKGLGNAVVPQIVEALGRMIMETTL